MIFASRNEKGELAADLVMARRKTVTRRTKPVAVGKIIAVQPGRTKKGIGHVKVISCELHRSWWFYLKESECVTQSDLDREAQAEGFETWDGLMKWFEVHKIQVAEIYRIEFELVKEI